MKTKNRNLFVFQDPLLTVVASIWTVVCVILCLWFYSFINKESNDAMIGYIVCSFMLLGIITCPVICAPQWYTVIRFSKDNIYILVPFKKSCILNYTNFPYVYIAYYYHWSLVGLSIRREYIILSNMRISDGVLKKANQIKTTKNTIKIKFSKHNLLFLERVLCPQQVASLKKYCKKNSNRTGGNSAS